MFDWMKANSILFSEVTDLLHNHDSREYGNSTESEEINRNPSHDLNNLNDWDTADYFVNHGVDSTKFTMTIEDANQVFRDFSYSDENKFRDLSQDAKENGRYLPSAVPNCPAGS